MNIAELARQYIHNRFPDLRPSYFDRAWITLTEKLAQVDGAKSEGFKPSDEPLGMAGNATPAPLQAIVLFVTADRLSTEGVASEDLLLEVQRVAARYEQQERFTQEILTLLRTHLGTQSVERKTAPTKDLTYRLWLVTSEPEGEPVPVHKKDSILADKKKRALVVLDERTRTSIFIHGREVAPPPPLLFRILVFTLKNRGSGGTSLEIARAVFSIEDNWGFRDLDALLAAIRMQPELYKQRDAELNDSLHPIGSNLAKVQSNIRKRVSDLKDYLVDNGLKVNLRAMGPLKQYQFDPVPNYCLIERVPLP